MTTYAVIPRAEEDSSSPGGLPRALVPLPARAEFLDQVVANDVLVVPVHLLSPEECAVVTAWVPGHQGRNLIVLWDGTRAEEVLALLSVSSDPHLVGVSGPHFASDLGFVLRKLLYPEEPLRSCLGAESQVWTWPLRSSAERHDVIHAAQEAMMGSGHNARSAGIVATLLEEFSSNALYDAPVDGQGVPRHRHLPRQQAVTLEAGEEVQLMLALADERAFVSARDPFGSFHRANLLEQARVFMKGDQRLTRAGPGGAGIGLLFAMDLGHHLMLEVRDGGWTEAASVVDFSPRLRQQRHRVKTFNLFSR